MSKNGGNEDTESEDELVEDQNQSVSVFCILLNVWYIPHNHDIYHVFLWYTGARRPIFCLELYSLAKPSGTSYTCTIREGRENIRLPRFVTQ